MRGITLLEILCAIVIVIILAAVLIPGFQKQREAAKEIVCAGNLRALGATLGFYAGDNRGEWPSCKGTVPAAPVHTYASHMAKDKGNFLGVGLLYPYAEKKLFFCPIGQYGETNLRRDWDAVANVATDYAMRGAGQTTLLPGVPQPRLGLMLADMGSRAILSCSFLYNPQSPNSKPVRHGDSYPVLFGDGRVEILGVPEFIDLENPPNLVSHTLSQMRFWDSFDSHQ